MLTHADDQMRLEAVVALAETRTPSAFELLLLVLQDTNQPLYLRSACAWALGCHATPQAAESLVMAFADIAPEIREEALAALANLGSVGIGPLVKGLTASPDIAAGSAEVLRRLRDVPVESIAKLAEVSGGALDLGGAYQRGVPVRSLYQYRVLLNMCDEVGFFLAEEFFWHNPAKLPSPIEWVNKRKLRAKDSVNTVWWLSKTEWPKADVRKVLVPYSERMKTLLKDPDKFYRPKDRPSGHDISRGFSSKNGGAIPPNLLQIPNTESNSSYLRLAKLVGLNSHPARFPVALPEFFIKFLTDHDDIVLDIFSGSNTTGRAAEKFGRRWIAMELDSDYVAGSALRFMEDFPEKKVQQTFKRLSSHRRRQPVDLSGPRTLFDATVGRTDPH